MKRSEEEIKRMRRAVTAAERRQDDLAGLPTDFLRHWRESEREERRLMMQRELQRQTDAGCCCPCKALIWLWSLRTARTCLAKWEKQGGRGASERC